MTKQDRNYFIFAAAIVIAWLALCMFGMANCDEIAAARSRLKTIEAERAEASALAAAKAKEATEAATVEAVELDEPLQPVPDPISRNPEINFETVASAGVITERLPRAVLVVSPHCSPCLRMERENPDLIGGKDAPVQLVKNWLANDLDELGITPGMMTMSPYLFILDKDGKVHGLKPTGLGCVLRGYHSPQQIREYLQQKDHGVSLAPLVKAPPVFATVEAAPISPETYAAALAAHLLESSGQHEGEPYLYGGLFDLTIDVPESWKSIAIKVLTVQRFEFATAGLTVDWSGPARSFSLSKTQLTITPPVRVSVKKWLLSYSAALDGIEFAEDLSRATFLLTGAPDLTVILK